MPLFKTKFHLDKFFVNLVDNREHPLKEVVRPLSPAQMLRRSLNGQPISCHNYSQDERLIFQKRFFGLGDKMDAIDSALKLRNDFNKKCKEAQEQVSEQPKQEEPK